MNIGLFGGTFDPIHRGHIALAQAAQEQFKLGRIYFTPANIPPHKQLGPLTSFPHRYAMIALATAGQKAFVPALLEAPPDNGQSAQANYSIATVRLLKSRLPQRDRLFFLIGIDAFGEIASWHEAEALFRECEFIVASRPGYSLADVANALPESLRPAPSVTKPFHKQPAKGDLVVTGATVHLLESVYHDVSATKVREAVAAGKSLVKYLNPEVAAYIKKTGLYQTDRNTARDAAERTGESVSGPGGQTSSVRRI
jgi:nicotinate-nucleotide adenylyltransferase